MTGLHITQTKKWPQRHREISSCMKLILFMCILISVIGLTSACDYSVELNITNQLSIDVKMVYSQYYKSFDSPTPYGSYVISDIIPAGQTGKLRTGIINGISGAPKVVLKAEDPSGNVVWQKTWTGKEFGKLEDVGWKVEVSPETSS